jgi:signal transduction histidine kinase
VHLQVRDSGVGTPGKELGKVFKAFHRADATRSGLHEFATKLVLDKRRLIPLSQVDQYLGLAGRSRNGAEVEFFGRC